MKENTNRAISEEIIFKLVSDAGDARSCLFEAFNYTKEGKYKKANNKMEKANESLMKAHNTQTKLIQEEARGNHVEINMLMVHAQDHIMGTMLAKELVENMMEMQKEINQLKENKR